MTVQFSTAVRNARANAAEATIGASPILRFYNGAKPADCATAAAGTKIAEGALPADWLTAAANGAVGKNGTWTVTGIAAAGTGTAAQYFRIYDAAGTTCHEQGSISVTGGGGDLQIDNTSIADTQVTTVTGYTLTEGNA